MRIAAVFVRIGPQREVGIGPLVDGVDGVMAGPAMVKPVDFRLKSELGAVKGSTLADWPITYADLAPYYDLAEEELGVSGNAVPHPFAEPRKGNYPLPPLAEHSRGHVSSG